MERIAIVVAEDHYNALGVIRSLGENNVPVYLVLLSNCSETYVDKSRYVTDCKVVSRDEKEILQQILSFVKNECYFLFPLSDRLAKLLDENFDVFPSNVHVPHANGSLKHLLDKSYAKSLAQQCGMDTPPSTIVELDRMSELRWDAYPAIIKPIVSMEGLKSDIRIVENSEKMLEELQRFKNDAYKRVLVEEYLTDYDERMVEVVGCVANGHVEYGGMIEKIREYPTGRGSTSFAKIVTEHPGISLDKITEFVSATSFNGLFDVEFKFAGNKAYFIECNFRNGAPGYAMTCIGKCLPLIWMRLLSGEKDFDLPAKTDSSFFMCEQTDVLHVLKRELSLRHWYRDYRKSNHIFVRKEDMAPIRKYVKMMMKVAWKKLRRI